MPEGSGIGLYPYGEVGYARENDEVSSTYEGRHLTVAASQISSHDPAHALQQKGHPLVVGENIVGVAFNTEVLGTDLISFDTEGIWLLSVVALNPAAVVITAGDELFINKATAIISNDPNKNTHAHFGYALGGVTAGNTAIISVKVHWDPDDAEEVVGTRAAPLVNAVADHEFRKYYYEAQGGGESVGDWLELEVSTLANSWAAAMFRRLTIPGDGNIVTGYAAVAELELAVGAGAGLLDTMTVLQMNNLPGIWTGTGHNNFALSWLRMADYAPEVNEQINYFFELNDGLATYPAANNDNDLFVVEAAWVVSHSLRILINGVQYWIGVSDAS